jgi:bifunctional pyridoxal-dependent enzyme with beta-cystathionase and maltose regulon repressor activities
MLFLRLKLTEYSCRLVYTPFRGADQFSLDAIDCYELALREAERESITIKALVISNPHNPLGIKLKHYIV